LSDKLRFESALSQKQSESSDHERREELERIKESFEKRLDDLKTSHQALIKEKQGQWEGEKAFMQGQLQFAQKQIEENKGMHEQLIAAINQKGSEKAT
jgi:hypothetical protein